MAFSYSSLTGDNITRDDLIDAEVIIEPRPVIEEKAPMPQPEPVPSYSAGANLVPVADSPKPVNELFKDKNGNLDLSGLDKTEKEILTADVKPDQAGFKLPGTKTFIVLVIIGLIAYLINEDYI